MLSSEPVGRRVRPRSGPGQCHRQICLVGPIAAVLGDRHAPAHWIECAKRVCRAQGQAVGEQRKREHVRIVGRLGGADQAGRNGQRLLEATAPCERDDEGCPPEFVGVVTAGQMIAVKRDIPFGLADGTV